MFGMIALTGVIMLALFFSRLPTIVQNFGNLQAAKHSDELRPRLPDTKRYITDNHNHLFEQPTVFYAIVVYIYLVQHVDSLHIMLAWAYVIFRAIHSIVHVTINNVSIRASVFVFSLICLVWMTIREGLFFLAIWMRKKSEFKISLEAPIPKHSFLILSLSFFEMFLRLSSFPPQTGCYQTALWAVLVGCMSSFGDM